MEHVLGKMIFLNSGHPHHTILKNNSLDPPFIFAVLEKTHAIAKLISTLVAIVKVSIEYYPIRNTCFSII